MREITSKATHKIEAVDDAGPGGANHLYRIHLRITDNATMEAVDIQFQKGPIGEVGVNGIADEALYAILIDRLQGFQRGQYSCRENAVALTHLETALLWLNKRTFERSARGVEGTSQK